MFDVEAFWKHQSIFCCTQILLFWLGDLNFFFSRKQFGWNFLQSLILLRESLMQTCPLVAQARKKSRLCLFLSPVVWSLWVERSRYSPVCELTDLLKPDRCLILYRIKTHHIFQLDDPTLVTLIQSAKCSVEEKCRILFSRFPRKLFRFWLARHSQTILSRTAC